MSGARQVTAQRTSCCPTRLLRTAGQRREGAREAGTAMQMGNRLYVGNLSFNTSRETLEATFREIGEVTDIAMPTDRQTGQPRGFAFVTMGTDELAAKAIAQLHGSMLDGRAIKVNEAQERAPGGGGGRGPGGGSRGGRRDRY